MSTFDITTKPDMMKSLLELLKDHQPVETIVSRLAFEYGMTLTQEDVIKGIKHLKVTNQLHETKTASSPNDLVVKNQELANLPQPNLPSSSKEVATSPKLSSKVVDAGVLEAFIKKFLVEGCSYEKLSNLVATSLGDQYRELLEELTSSIEVHRKNKLNPMKQFPKLQATYGAKFSSYALALSKLPLSSDRSFPVSWKTMILSSKPTQPTSPATSVATNLQPSSPEVAGSSEEVTNIDQLKLLALQTQMVGGSDTSTPEEPYDARFKKFQNQCNLMWKAKVNFDPAGLADSMGYHDIAANWRSGAITSSFLGQPMPGPQQVPSIMGGGSGEVDMAGEIQKVMRMMIQWKMMAPILQTMTQSMGGEQAAGNPQYAELLRRLEQDKTLENFRRDIQTQIERLQSSNPNPQAQNQIAQLQWQLEQLQKTSTQSQETERLKTLLNATGKSTEENTKLSTQIETLRLENQRQIDALRLANEADKNRAIEAERQMYRDQLNQLQQRVADMSKGTGNPLETYTQIATVVDNERKRVDELIRQSGGQTGESIPGILKDVAIEFAPALTAALQARQPQPSVGGPQMASAARPIPTNAGGLMNGECPYCKQPIQIPDIDEVPCPKCGGKIWPHGQPKNPQPTATPTQYVDSAGVTHEVRDPKAPLLV